MKKMLWVMLLMCMALPGWATVMNSADSGFEVKVEVEVDVSGMEAYQQFLKVDEWWDANHSWFGKASGFSLEPVAGGCFCEKEGDKSVLHMLVSFVDPGRRVAMLGGLGPLQDLGLQGAMSWTFEPVSESRTRIIHVYRVTGYYPGGLQQLALAVDGVQTGQVDRLAARIAGEL